MFSIILNGKWLLLADYVTYDKHMNRDKIICALSPSNTYYIMQSSYKTRLHRGFRQCAFSFPKLQTNKTKKKGINY